MGWRLRACARGDQARNRTAAGGRASPRSQAGAGGRQGRARQPTTSAASTWCCSHRTICALPGVLRRGDGDSSIGRFRMPTRPISTRRRPTIACSGSRNALLRDGSAARRPELLEVYDTQLVAAALPLYARRRRMVEELARRGSSAPSAASRASFRSLGYRTRPRFRRARRNRRQLAAALRFARAIWRVAHLGGPHTDDPALEFAAARRAPSPLRVSCARLCSRSRLPRSMSSPNG